METYLTIEGLAEYLKLAEQTIRRWVLNNEVPYHKIKKVIRFRVSEIEKWIDNGGIQATEGCPASSESEVAEGLLFVDAVLPEDLPEETADGGETAETKHET